ncbi:hypothetical protein AB1Y20_015966 [Prymnesium parvum]|uniref:Transcription factor CBF/NF-Y/archaeal histone domain-containing protein n=1 Tax=Prymnesium parvum TaxID=97485 RepID=A0AB34K215_PRYPA
MMKKRRRFPAVSFFPVLPSPFPCSQPASYCLSPFPSASFIVCCPSLYRSCTSRASANNTCAHTCREPPPPTLWQARVKKMMQLDDDVGKIAAAVPDLLGLALEEFGAGLVARAAAIATAQGAVSLQVAHIKQCVHEDEVLADFLKQTVEQAPAEGAGSARRAGKKPALSTKKRKLDASSSSTQLPGVDSAPSYSVGDGNQSNTGDASGAQLSHQVPPLYANGLRSSLLDEDDDEYD